MTFRRHEPLAPGDPRRSGPQHSTHDSGRRSSGSHVPGRSATRDRPTARRPAAEINCDRRRRWPGTARPRRAASALAKLTIPSALDVAQNVCAGFARKPPASHELHQVARHLVGDLPRLPKMPARRGSRSCRSASGCSHRGLEGRSSPSAERIELGFSRLDTPFSELLPQRSASIARRSGGSLPFRIHENVRCPVRYGRQRARSPDLPAARASPTGRAPTHCPPSSLATHADLGAPGCRAADAIPRSSTRTSLPARGQLGGRGQPCVPPPTTMTSVSILRARRADLAETLRDPAHAETGSRSRSASM